MANIFHVDKFLTGLKYGSIAEAALLIVIAIIWVIATGSLAAFPIAFLLFGFGGVLLTIAGCVGPGRYHKEYKLLVYTPESGSSFSNEIIISGFSLDPSIKEADVIVNGEVVANIGFDEQGLGSQVITREDITPEIINSVYFKSEEIISNSNEFTLFEYTEEMTEEEIDELYQLETGKPLKSLEEAKQSYLERTGKGMGSIAIALGTLAILNFILNIILGSFDIFL